MVEYYNVQDNKRTFIGLTQSNRCLESRIDYSVQNIPTSSTNSTLHMSNPIIYKGDSYSCIDNEHINSCDALRNVPMFQLTSDLFSRHFTLPKTYSPKENSINYFAVITYVYLLIHIPHTMIIYNEVFPHVYINLYTLFTEILSILNMIYIMPISYHSYYSNITTYTCGLIMTDLNEAATFCRQLTSCGLTIASGYYPNNNTNFTTIMYTLGIIIICISSIHIVLFILYIIYQPLSVYYTEERVHIFRLGLDQSLNTALKEASTIFISDYLSNWKYIYRSPIPTTVAVAKRAVSGAVYSPLATSYVAGGGTGGAYASDVAGGGLGGASPTIATDVEADDAHKTTIPTAEESPRGEHICILCNKPLFT